MALLPWSHLVAHGRALWKLTAPWTHRTHPPRLGKRCPFSTTFHRAFSHQITHENPRKAPKYRWETRIDPFIWLKNPWNLTEAQHRRLGELEHLNLKINRAYLLKELFAHFWSYRTAGWAKRHLKRWFWWATHSRLPPLRDFAWILRRHETDILNYFRMPIDNGTVEGLNNKAKLIIHRAYGFRTAKNQIRNLYHCMADLPLPQTVHTFV